MTTDHTMDYDRINNMSVKKISPKKKKVVNVLFVVSKSGNKNPRIDFYDKGKPVSSEKINITYKNSISGRFVSEKYINKKDTVTKEKPERYQNKETNPHTRAIGRSAKSGHFIAIKDDRMHPNTTIVERISKNSPVYFTKVNHKKK